MAPPSTIKQAVSLIERDPVLGFVMIPVLAIAADNHRAIIAKVRGRDVALPVWTGNEWLWYGSLATDVARRLQPGTFTKVLDAVLPALESSGRDLGRAAAKLNVLIKPMASIGNDVVPADMAGIFYKSAVELVIAAVAEHGNKRAGTILAESFKESGLEFLQAIPDKIRAVFNQSLAMTEGALSAAGNAALNVLDRVFGVKAVAKGIVIIGAIGLGLWALSEFGSRREREE